MAGRLSCCLNLPLPNSNSSPSNKSSSQSLWRRLEKEIAPDKGKIGIHVFRVAAFLMIGVAELHRVDGAATAKAAVDAPVAMRWSDKRMCPAWRVNSLETIVPENLPRPSSRRSWRFVGADVGDAPPVRSAVKRANKADCFSM